MQTGHDDDSNLFMSEPSMSEVDESSERQMGALLSPFGSFTEDEEDNDGLPPPPPPPARILAPPSPGNTSLSSWESPHPNRRIQLHFSPGGDSLSHKAESISAYPQYHRTHIHQSSSPTPPYQTSDPYLSSGLLPPTAGVKTPERSIVHSSNSTSPVSEGQQNRLNTFLDDLRVNSEGQVHESAGTNTSFDSSIHPGPPVFAGSSIFDFSAILRSGGLIKRTQSMPKGNFSIENDDDGSVDNKSVDGNGANDTVVMVLSDDSVDEAMKKIEEPVERKDDEQTGLADDKKNLGSRHNRAIRSTKSLGGNGGRNNGASGRGHRRQRSGDVAAATLSTGSKEWKGMEQDKIPLPPVPGGDDEDDDDDQEQPSTVNARGDRPRSVDVLNKVSGERPMETSSNLNNFQSTIDEAEGFNLGIVGGQESHKRTRQKRESYRGRKLAGLLIDSEDSSSLASGGRAVGATRRGRNSALNASAFNGHKTSPDWSAPSSPKHSQVHQQVNWDPKSHQAGQTYPQNDMELGNWRGYALGPEEFIPRTHDDPLNRSSVDLGFRSLSFSPRITSGNNSMGTIDSSFSRLSDRRNTMESLTSFQGSESSPLIASGARNYDGRGLNGQSNSFRVQEFDSPDQGVRLRPKIIISPLMQEGRKIFEATPFSKIGNGIGNGFRKADRRSFLPESGQDDHEKYQTFVCPICQTRQREFFTVSNAPRQFESASGYIAFYFGLYVIASLYIFGLQEGWGKLDCIYFAGQSFPFIIVLCHISQFVSPLRSLLAVITLTTAGLGRCSCRMEVDTVVGFVLTACLQVISSRQRMVRR